jgi:hypothetical protein
MKRTFRHAFAARFLLHDRKGTGGNSTHVSRLLCMPRRMGALTTRGDGSMPSNLPFAIWREIGRRLVVPGPSSAAEAQAARVMPGLAGVAVRLPIRHRGAGGLEALGLDRRVQRRMQRQSLNHGGKP